MGRVAKTVQNRHVFGKFLVLAQDYVLENSVHQPACDSYNRTLWNALLSSFIYLILFHISSARLRGGD